MTKYRIISFDGGGMKGALSIKLLELLTNEIPQLLNKTNLFAGTSTGGLIALALASGKTPSDIVKLYGTKGNVIFQPYKPFRNSKEDQEIYTSLLGSVSDIKDLLFSKYDNKKFKLLLVDIFKDNTTLGCLKKHVIVTTFQLNNKNGWGPIILSNLPNSDYLEFKCVDAALCTSAAPTYFPIHQGYVDGGVYANNPSLVALSNVLDNTKIGANIEDINLLSFGTGKSTTYANVSGETPWGAALWLSPYSTSGMPKVPLIGILRDGYDKITHYICSNILGIDKYFRVNLNLNKHYDMDNWKDVQYLFDYAEDFVTKNKTEWDYLVEWTIRSLM